jgi:hypothetical protein
MTDGMIDLGAARAARREGKATSVKVGLGVEGEPLIELPVELPVDSLSPLKRIELDRDFGLLVAARDQAAAEQVLRDLITVKPTRGTELLSAGQECLERLFCSDLDECELDPEPGERTVHGEDCDWPRFLSWRPSTQDYVVLLKGLWAAYGAALGEAFGSSGSSGTGGATSKPISPGSTRRPTRAASSRTPAPTGS